MSAASGAIEVVDLAPYTDRAEGATTPGDRDPGVAELLASVDAALRDTGFMAVVGHRVPVADVERAQRTAFEFFDLPEEDRGEAMAATHHTRGYTPLGGHALGHTLAADDEEPPPADLFERYRIGPIDLPEDDYTAARRDGVFAPNVWPERAFPAFRPVMSAYFRTMRSLARDIARVFALTLGLDEHWFDPLLDREMSSLVINHYPAPDRADLGRLRTGEHTDYGTLTIVAPTAAPGGLEVRIRGVWRPVVVPPDAFVVNIGDLMARWTNDRWISTLHRVVTPPEDQVDRSRRLSLVFFQQPNEDALIETIPTCVDDEHPARHGPVTAGVHIGRKISRHFETATAPAVPGSP